jgi:quinol monooxygenase YgiN
LTRPRPGGLIGFVKVITALVRIAPEHWDEARELAEAHSRASREEPGCLSHDWFAHPAEDHTLFFFERWADQAAIDAHFTRPSAAGLVGAFRQWACSPLTLRILDVADVRELAIGAPEGEGP